MDQFEEEILEPVSPLGQYCNSSVLSISVLAVLEIGTPIDDSQTISLIRDILLPIHPRFSSIMVLFSFPFLVCVCISICLYILQFKYVYFINFSIIQKKFSLVVSINSTVLAKQ